MKTFLVVKIKRIEKKRVTAVITSLLIITVAANIFLYNGYLVNWLWRDIGLPPPASWIRDDAIMAKEIGEYYINWKHEGAYNLDKSYKYLKRADSIEPGLSGTAYQLGRIAFLTNQLRSALARFDEQLALYEYSKSDQYYYPSIYMKALTNGFLEEFDDAEEGFQRLVAENKGDSHSWAYYTDLAWVYFQRGKYLDIEELMVEGLKRYPDNPWVLNMYGLALHNLGKSEKSVNYLEKALMEANKLTESDWQIAYPGNDPRISSRGLDEMIGTIESNLALASGRK